MILRKATLSDVDNIRACAEAAYSPYIADIGRKPAPMIADFAALAQQGSVDVLCRDADSKDIAGFVVCQPKQDHMLLENVAVHPDMSGRGHGTLLIRHCEGLAAHAGYGLVRLYTNEKMTANLTIYPRLGYRETDRRHEDGFDRVYFEKRLP